MTRYFSPLPFLIEARRLIANPDSFSYGKWGEDAKGKELLGFRYSANDIPVRMGLAAAVLRSMGNLIDIRSNLNADLGLLVMGAKQKLFPDRMPWIHELSASLTHEEALALLDRAIEDFKEKKLCSTSLGGAFVQFRSKDFCTPTDYGTHDETYKGWVQIPGKPGEMLWIVKHAREVSSDRCAKTTQRRPLILCQTTDFTNEYEL